MLSARLVRHSRPKGGATDRPSRERGLKARTIGSGKWDWRLMSGTRQQIQYSLALEPVDGGEPPVSGHQGAEPSVAKPAFESPASAEQLMEEVCNRENLVRAWKRIRRNQGSAGVDGMTIDDARDYLVSTGPAFGLNCSKEPTSRSRSSGSKSPSRTVGSESSACLASSTD